MKTKVLFTILCSMLWVGSIKAQLKVGDAHLDGIVAVLNADGKSGLIMQKSNISMALSWRDANTAIRNLGNGWRFPTGQECTSMHNNNSVLKIPATSYWTSSPNGTYGVVYSFSSTHSVCAVKPF